MDNGNLSASDVALLNRDDNYGGSWIWFLAILLLMGNNWNNNNPAYATQAEMNAGFNNQTTQSQLQQIALSSANNNYETAQIVNNQTEQIMQQNNANMINAIQGFNQVNQNISAQGSQITQAISQLGYQLDQCCGSIKTQMLQNRLDDTQAKLVSAQGAISNANQSQYLLNQLGRFVAWDSSGTQANVAG